MAKTALIPEVANMMLRITTTFPKFDRKLIDSYCACNLKHHVVNWVSCRDIWHWKKQKGHAQPHEVKNLFWSAL